MGEHKKKDAAVQHDTFPMPPEAVSGAVTNSRSSFLTRRNVVVVISAGVFLVVVGVVGLLFLKHRQPSYAGQVCGNTLAQQGNDQNKLANVTTFGQLVDAIKLKDNYASDPDCLYIIAEYQITAGDLSNAKSTMDLLQSKYKRYKFNQNSDDGHASIANLQKQYDTMQSALNNSRGVIDPGI